MGLQDRVSGLSLRGDPAEGLQDRVWGFGFKLEGLMGIIARNNGNQNQQRRENEMESGSICIRIQVSRN